MAAHVADIFIEKFKDKKGHVAVFGAVDGFEQFAANGGELEGEEIIVRPFQVVGEALHRNVFEIHGGGVAVGMYVVGHGKEGGGVHARLVAHLLHCALSAAEGDAEAAHGL